MTKQRDTISIMIQSPDAIVWQGEALSLTSTNSEGDFDIMPDHARFMSIIENVPIIIYKEGGEEQIFTFDSAVLFFEDNNAKIYTHKGV